MAVPVPRGPIGTSEGSSLSGVSRPTAPSTGTRGEATGRVRVLSRSEEGGREPYKARPGPVRIAQSASSFGSTVRLSQTPSEGSFGLNEWWMVVGTRS
jgi:hypothetical protein